MGALVIFEPKNEKTKLRITFIEIFMQKKTHIIFGIFLASILFYLGMPIEYIILVGFISFFPDIDRVIDKVWLKENSLAKRIWKKIFGVGSMHRRLLHNVWVMIILMLIFGYFSSWDLFTILGTFVGFLSHLIMDSLTITGIYWLWPYGDERIFGKRKFYKNGNFRTGSLAEKGIQTFFLIGGGIFFGFGFYKLGFFREGNIFQVIMVIMLLIALGIVFMDRIVRELSRATSRIFS